MHFLNLWYAVGIAIHAVSIIALPIAGKSRFNNVQPHLPIWLHGADFNSGPIDASITLHLSKRDREGIAARSPEDVVPVADCKRAPVAKSNFNEALYRRCGEEGEGEGEGGEESEPDGDGEGEGEEDGDAENVQTASNSPRQDCILTQMALFPMPNLGLCESLPDAPPTPDPAPHVTPHPAPITPPPPPAESVSEPVPVPAHKPVPANAGGPARAVPKQVIETHDLEGELV